MANLDCLFQKYDRLVLFDTETTGLDYARDEIIEFAACVVEQIGGKCVITEQYDELVSLSPGGFVPPQIEALTGISTQDLRERGLTKARVCRDIGALLRGNCLLMAYNAHFDLCFLYYLLLREGDPAILQGKDKVDLLTVYRDRHPYPQKLKDAIEVYGLSDQVVNSHRAVDDVIATVAVLEKMDEERADLDRYINLFGYLAKYGISGKPIRSIAYRPQEMEVGQPIYTQADV